MSRSKHQTIKSVFGGKSAGEINAMLAGNDEDAVELIAKGRLKREARKRRVTSKD